MTIATKNGAIIVKDGKLAENCGCCGDWYCDQDYGACCAGTQCENKYRCDCASPSVFKNSVPCGSSVCACVYPTLEPLPGAITSGDNPMIGRRLPIACTLSDGKHTFSGNYYNIQTPDYASLLAFYGSEASGSLASDPPYSCGRPCAYQVQGVWLRYLRTPFTLSGPFAGPCCGDVVDGNTFVNGYFSCKADGSWLLDWSVAMWCYAWTRDSFYGTYSYVIDNSHLYSDGGSIVIPAAENGLPTAGTHSLSSGNGSGTPCQGYILGASISISHTL